MIGQAAGDRAGRDGTRLEVLAESVTAAVAFDARARVVGSPGTWRWPGRRRSR